MNDLKKNPILILNPKCASTSLRKALNYKPPKTHHIHLELSHPKIQRLIANTQNPWIGCPIRNPIDRAISCYFFWRKKRKRAVRENHVLQVFANAMTCSEFWERIDIEDLAKTIPHFRTQWSFISSNPDQIDQFIRFENLRDDFNRFCRMTGTSPKALPHVTKSNRNHFQITDLSAKALKKISNYYEGDLTRFNYQQ